MKNNLTWISFSLFCQKIHWNILLANGITPFLTNNDLLRYSIEFNCAGGENVKLSLLVPEKDINKWIKETEGFFKLWFSKSNLTWQASANDAVILPAENIIRLMPHQPQKITLEEKAGQSLSISLSRIILEALKEDIIDDDAILTFAFYLQIALIKVSNNTHPGFINTLKPAIITQGTDKKEVAANQNGEMPYISIEGKTEEELLEEKNALDYLIMEKVVINKKFEEDKKTLFEITRDIISNNTTIDWLEQWLFVCKTEINKPDTGTGINLAYLKIVSELHLHLGITSQMCTLLTYFVQRALRLINPPSAIIIGVQKCGTTTLHHNLITHSNIKTPISPEDNKPIKEVNFFGLPEKWNKGIDWYFSHFIGSKGLYLDSSPNYIMSDLICKRMRTAVPEAKLIICMRNPVIRAYSQYNHYKQILPVSLTWDWLHDKDFLTNIQMELNFIKKKLLINDTTFDPLTRFGGIVLRGVYIKQIKNLLDHYDRSQIYITITDWWPNNYEKELDNIQQFLGLEKEVLLTQVMNKREYTVEPFDEEAKQLLTDFYKPYNQELFEFLGYEIPEWG